MYEYHESYLIVIATLTTTMRMVQDMIHTCNSSTKSVDETAGSLSTACDCGIGHGASRSFFSYARGRNELYGNTDIGDGATMIEVGK